MKKHLFLFILTLVVLSVSNAWAGEQYIFPVTSTTPCGGSSVENKLDNNTRVIYMANNSDNWADFYLNIPAAKTFLLYVGYSSNTSGNLRPFTNDIERGTSGFSTSTGWYDVKEINCGASGVLQAGDNKISICNNGANFNLMYIRLEEQDAATWDVPVDMNIYWTTKDGEVITNSDFSYVKTSDGTPKADMVDNANTSGKVFMKEAITATSRKSVYFPTTGTYCFTFPIYVKDHATYSMPTITVNGNTSSATSVTTDTDNEFKDVTIELDVTAGTYPVVINYSKTDDKIGYRYVTITKKPVSCTAPNHVDISGNWDYFGGETISLSAQAYSSSGTGSPIDEEDIIGYQWKHNGSDIDGATSKTFTKTNCTSADGGDYSCVVSTGATCSTESSPMGTKVYVLQCYTGGETSYNFTRTGSSQAGTTTVTLSASTQYEFKIYAGSTASTDYHMGNNGTIDEDATNWDFEGGKNNVKLNSGLGGTFTFAIDYSANGGAPKVSVTYPRKRIYLNTGGNDLWSKDNVTKFGVYYFRQDASSGWSDLMDVYPCGSNIYYTEIPQWNGVKMDVVRLSNDATNANKSNWWTSYKFNQTNDCPVSSNDYITITGWNEANYTYETFSVPTFTVTYNANGDGAGNATGTTGSVPTDSNSPYDCGSDVTILGNTGSLAKVGYDFDGWNTAPDGSEDPYAAGETLSNITANTVLYAQWAIKSYTLTWDLAGGTVTTAGTQADVDDTGSPSGTVNYGETVTAPTVTKTGYNFSAWSPAVASTMPAANTTYTATWTIKTTTITIDDNDENHGSTTPGTVTATWGQALPAFTAASGVAGYGLVGYYTGATAGTKIINADGTLVRNTTYATDEDTPKWKYEGATETFYPHYDPLYTVTVNDDGNGSGEADKAAYFAGETVTITATPSSGYIFDEWTTSDGVSFASSTTSPTTFTMPSSNVTVQANFEEKTCSDTRVIQCEDYDPDITKPSRGHDKPGNYQKQGKRIDGGDGGYGDAYGDAFASFRDSGNDKEIFYNIYLPAATYTFTVRCANGGLKKVVLYNAAGDEKLQELELGNEWTNNSWYNYTTSSWTASSSDNYYIGLRAEGQWAVFDQMTITANSEVFCQYTVSATATNGSVTGTGTYYAGETVSLTPSADPGYEFTAWSSLSGVTVSGYEDDNPLTFTMPDNAVSVTASFETSCTPHDITLTNDGNGSATASPTSACEDADVEITATPNTGYHFDYWSATGVSISGNEYDNPLAITMPDGDISVAAHFLRSIIATGDANLGTHTGYADKNASMSVSNVDDPEGKFDHKVLQITYTMNSDDNESSYYGMSLPVDAGYSTSIASGKTGMGFWYRTASTTDQVLMYFCISSTSDQFEVLLPATNGKWQYWYIETDKVDDSTTFGFYINGTKNGKSSGVIGSEATVWLSEVEPLTPADVTVDDGEPEEIAPVVRDLTIYQGSEVSNAADVIVTRNIYYHRHAKGGALSNKLDQWYTFAVPFTVSGIEVKESSTWYAINAVHYTTNGDQSSEPDGPGHFYLQYLEDDDKNQMTNDRWRYVNPGHSLACVSEWEENDGTRFGYPKKDEAYIILFDSKGPGSDLVGYWASNSDIRFVGGPQTIAATAWTPEYDTKETEYWMYPNNTLHSITLTNDAYVLNSDGTMFVLQDKPTIRPFECYIQATEEFKAVYSAMPLRRPLTPTAIEELDADSSRTIKVLHQGHLIIIRNGQGYNLMGARVR